ncbi:hypothetical protein J6590_067290, partial [Homalodisca vitripennis]
LDELENIHQLHFQRDGASSHFSALVTDALNFVDRWIGRQGRMLWPPRSPNLTPCDFFSTAEDSDEELVTDRPSVESSTSEGVTGEDWKEEVDCRSRCKAKCFLPEPVKSKHPLRKRKARAAVSRSPLATNSPLKGYKLFSVHELSRITPSVVDRTEMAVRTREDS